MLENIRGERVRFVSGILSTSFGLALSLSLSRRHMCLVKLRLVEPYSELMKSKVLLPWQIGFAVLNTSVLD